MSSSQPASPDPLAPKPSVATAPVAAAATPGQPAEQPAAKKKGSAVLLIGLGCVLLLLLAGAGAAAVMFLPKGEAAPAISSTPLAPDPGNPPPLPQFTLASATSASAANSASSISLDELESAGKKIAARLVVGAGETTAPKDMIVRGGSASDGADYTVPHHQRWELKFPVGMTIESYSRQLDFFKIELGVIGGSANVSYITNLSNPKPKVDVKKVDLKNGSQDTWVYLIWGRGPMREADEMLVARAGLDPKGKVLAHFLPLALEAEMLRLEAAAAQTNRFTRIRKTVFGIQTIAADTFRLTVTEQQGD